MTVGGFAFLLEQFLPLNAFSFFCSVSEKHMQEETSAQDFSERSLYKMHTHFSYYGGSHCASSAGDDKLLVP